MRSRERDGILVAAGAGIMLTVLLVLQSFIGTGLLSARTVTMMPGGYEQVSEAYSSHLLNLDSRNITALVEGYERNATLQWVCSLRSCPPDVSRGEVANFTNAGRIQILLLHYFSCCMENLSMSGETWSMSPSNHSSIWLVDSAFHLDGYDPLFGTINATVVAQDWYAQVSTQPALGGNTAGSWLISKEVWNFTVYNEQYPPP